MYRDFLTDKNNLITKGIAELERKKASAQALLSLDFNGAKKEGVEEKDPQVREADLKSQNAKFNREIKNNLVLMHSKLITTYLSRCADSAKASVAGAAPGDQEAAAAAAAAVAAAAAAAAGNEGADVTEDEKEPHHAGGGAGGGGGAGAGGGGGGSAAAKRKRDNFSSFAVAIMTKWTEQHIQNPYPNPEEKIELARLAGLSYKQVCDWFINYRNRVWKPQQLGKRPKHGKQKLGLGIGANPTLKGDAKQAKPSSGENRAEGDEGSSEETEPDTRVVGTHAQANIMAAAAAAAAAGQQVSGSDLMAMAAAGAQNNDGTGVNSANSLLALSQGSLLLSGAQFNNNWKPKGGVQNQPWLSNPGGLKISTSPNSVTSLANLTGSPGLSLGPLTGQPQKGLVGVQLPLGQPGQPAPTLHQLVTAMSNPDWKPVQDPSQMSQMASQMSQMASQMAPQMASQMAPQMASQMASQMNQPLVSSMMQQAPSQLTDPSVNGMGIGNMAPQVMMVQAQSSMPLEPLMQPQQVQVVQNSTSAAAPANSSTGSPAMSGELDKSLPAQRAGSVAPRVAAGQVRPRDNSEAAPGAKKPRTTDKEGDEEEDDGSTNGDDDGQNQMSLSVLQIMSDMAEAAASGKALAPGEVLDTSNLIVGPTPIKNDRDLGSPRHSMAWVTMTMEDGSLTVELAELVRPPNGDEIDTLLYRQDSAGAYRKLLLTQKNKCTFNSNQYTSEYRSSVRLSQIKSKPFSLNADASLPTGQFERYYQLQTLVEETNKQLRVAKV